MYRILFYKDRRGREPVSEYLEELAGKQDKDSRIKFSKIQHYINAIEEFGTAAGKPYIDHIEGEIWELRPLRDRIFFVAWNGDSFVLLHHFMKKTRKTPRSEIEQAKRELADLKERGDYS